MKNIKDIDDYWLKGLMEGDRKAYSYLFTRYSRLIYTLAYRYMQSREDAEDVVQYTFLKVWEQREILDFSKGVRSLLYTIMYHHVLDMLKHRQVVENGKDFLKLNESVEDVSIWTFECRDLCNCLNRAISSMPSQKKKICKLKFYNELTNQEIAEALHISECTVKSHYTSILKSLRILVKRWGYTLFLFIFTA